MDSFSATSMFRCCDESDEESLQEQQQSVKAPAKSTSSSMSSRSESQVSVKDSGPPDIPIAVTAEPLVETDQRPPSAVPEFEALPSVSPSSESESEESDEKPIPTKSESSSSVSSTGPTTETNAPDLVTALTHFFQASTSFMTMAVQRYIGILF